MPTLTEPQRDGVLSKISTHLSARKTPLQFNKAELCDAVEEIDAWLNTLDIRGATTGPVNVNASDAELMGLMYAVAKAHYEIMLASA